MSQVMYSGENEDNSLLSRDTFHFRWILPAEVRYNIRIAS